MLPKTWLEYQQYADVNVDIKQIFYNAYCIQKKMLRNISRVGIPKSTVLVIIFRVFLWPLSLRNAGPRSIIHLQCFKMVSKKIRDHLIKARWTMELLCRLLILKWHTKKRKIAVPHLKKMNIHCYSLKTQDDALFKNGFKKTAVVLRPLKSVLNFEVCRLSLQ